MKYDLKLQFTNHALAKMQERAIREDEIYEVFEGPILVRAGNPSIIVGKTRRGRTLSLIIDEKRELLITIWPASRRQRGMYERRKK